MKYNHNDRLWYLYTKDNAGLISLELCYVGVLQSLGVKKSYLDSLSPKNICQRLHAQHYTDSGVRLVETCPGEDKDIDFSYGELIVNWK